MSGGELFKPREGIGEHGAEVPGPPWILGRRGAPREAPENTLASLRRAVELGLDGFSYELRACLSGELVLSADERLERTTDQRGPLAACTLPELAAADAGSWFAKRFAGEPLALFEETFELLGNRAGTHPQHLIELTRADLVPGVARTLSGAGRHLSVRVASPLRSVCAEARDAGLEALWLVPRADERVRATAREEGFPAVGARGGFAPGESWSSERWVLGADDPAELLAALAARVNGLSTTEPRRALALRALAFLAGEVPARSPLEVQPLAIEPGARLGEAASGSSAGLAAGEWCGRWELEARVENPLPFEVGVALELRVRRGAFDARGLPAGVRLLAGQAARVPFELTGGSWRLGGDPLLVARFHWEAGPGRPAGRLALDVPLERRRTLRLDEGALRLELVREHPRAGAATVTARRSGRDLLVSIEDAGGLERPRLIVHLDGEVHAGAQGLRLRLPEDAHRRSGGVPFSAGIEGFAGGGVAPHGERTLRRWAGGLPDPLDGGAPGRLVLEARG